MHLAWRRMNGLEITFGDRNEFEVYVEELAGIAGLIAAAGFKDEGERGDVFRAASHLQGELERLAIAAVRFEAVGVEEVVEEVGVEDVGN